MKRPGQARVRPACHNKTMRSSLTSLELNASPAASHLATSNLETTPLSTTATSPDSGAGCGHGVGQMGEAAAFLADGQERLEQELGKILEEVRYISKRFRDQDEEETLCNEWKFAASVIDRLCLMAFSLFTILCTLGMLMSAPNFVEAISKDFLN